MDEPYDLTVPGEALAYSMFSLGLELEKRPTDGVLLDRFRRFLQHPNLPYASLEPYLRQGHLAAWLNPSTPLLLLADPSLFEGLRMAVRAVVYLGLEINMGKLKELHPDAVERLLAESSGPFVTRKARFNHMRTVLVRKDP
jgi:hypothetical protein